MACGLAGLWKCLVGVADNSLILHEVKLKRDGLHVEIGLLDWTGKAKKANKFTLDIRELTPPPLYSDSHPLRGDLFPHITDAFELDSQNPNLPWTKYYDVVRKRVFIPKDYYYMDKELMVAVMNGFYIKTN
jgi:hypothetical protein